MSVRAALLFRPARPLLVVAAFVTFLAVLAPVPLANAQQPTPFAVQIAPVGGASDAATADECAAFGFVVRNTGQLPFPPQHTIALTFNTPTGGWTLDRSGVPATIALAAQAESAQMSFRLCASDDAADGDASTVTLTATVNDDPNAPRASDTQDFTATYEGTGLFGLDVPATFLWIALGGIALIFAIVLVTRRRTSAGLSVTCPEPAKEVVPGRGTSFPIRIRNEGRDRDVVSLTTSPVPRGWDTFLPLVDIALEGREEQTVWLSVKSPDDAQSGDRVVVKVIARSSSGGNEQAAIDTLTTVRGDDAPPERLMEFEPPAAEESVYQREDAQPRPVAVKRRKAT